MTRNRSFKVVCLLMIFTSSLYFSCAQHQKGKGEIKSILILGNSIVEHGPASQIGWNGNWGMAATTRDSDFVHLLIAEIKAKDPGVTFAFANIGGFEFKPDFNYSRLDSFATPDMLILRFSENVNDTTVNKDELVKNYDKLIHAVDPEDKAVKVIVTGIWHRPKTHAMQKEYALKHHYLFVRNDDLLADSANTAKGLFANKDVAAHPSDKGMRQIKERIWEQIKIYF
jgi:hypothetical protein